LISNESDHFLTLLYVYRHKDQTSKVLCLGIALYGAESWTFREVHQKYLESFEILC